MAEDDKKRQRRAHKKSRNGCIECKQRHARCSESKPKCDECRARGRNCTYPRQIIPGDLERRKPKLIKILPATPADPFDSLPFQMSLKSPQLLYYYLDARTNLEIVLPRTYVLKRLGLADYNAGWFYTSLCYAAAHTALARGSLFELEETFLLLRLNIIHMVQQCTGDTVPPSIITMVGTLAICDYAVGDDTSADIHTNAVLALLASKQFESGHRRFFPYLLKRVALLSFAVLSFARNPEWVSDLDRVYDEASNRCACAYEGRELRWTIIQSMYHQLKSEFLQDPLTSGRPCKFGRGDEPLLRWFQSSIQTKWDDGGKYTKATPCPNCHKCREDNSRWAWKYSVAAYAIAVGGIDWGIYSRPNDEQSLEAVASPNILKLQDWCHEHVSEWDAGPKPMTREMSRAVAKKMLWIGSAEGLPTVEDIWASLKPHHA